MEPIEIIIGFSSSGQEPEKKRNSACVGPLVGQVDSGVPCGQQECSSNLEFRLWQGESDNAPD